MERYQLSLMKRRESVDQNNHHKIPLNPPFSKGEAPISSLWPPARRASGPEGKGRLGGICKEISNSQSVLHIKILYLPLVGFYVPCYF